MAERRMFAKNVIDSDMFLEMPITSQLLYFHLSMRADDDGFINKPKSIMRLIGCKDDDIKLLISNQFVIPFESGVVVIRHWKVHNYIQKDRYKPTPYQEEMSRITLNESNVYNVDTECTQSVSNMDTQDRLGKDRLELGKDRLELGKDRLELGESKNEPDGSAPKPSKLATRHKYGEDKHVLLSDEQYSKLISDFGEQKASEYIKRCDEYVQQTGKSYKDYNLTIRNWIRKDNEKNGNVRNNGTGETVRQEYGDIL